MQEPNTEPTCLNCRYWNMWENNCVIMCLFHDDYATINPHTPACPDYKPEDPDK